MIAPQFTGNVTDRLFCPDAPKNQGFPEYLA
jgi:hypothetical protein